MKSFWKSKTFWFNLILYLIAQLKEIDPNLLVSSFAAGNLALRSVTRTGLRLF